MFVSILNLEGNYQVNYYYFLLLKGFFFLVRIFPKILKDHWQKINSMVLIVLPEIYRDFYNLVLTNISSKYILSFFTPSFAKYANDKS